MKHSFAHSYLTLLLSFGIVFWNSTFLLAQTSAGSDELKVGLSAAKIGDYVHAMQSFQKAAAQGNDQAEKEIGDLYANGLGATQDQDYEQAMMYYRQSASKGNIGAENAIGICYEKGLGVWMDYTEAMNWFQKAFAQGDKAALKNIEVLKSLSFCAESSPGLVELNKGLKAEKSGDYTQAMIWYRKAADLGNANAENSIGELYSTGRTENGDQDFHSAMRWYRKAAKKGFAPAEINIGYLYDDGLGGVIRDHKEAMKWYLEACGNNFKIPLGQTD